MLCRFSSSPWSGMTFLHPLHLTWGRILFGTFFDLNILHKDQRTPSGGAGWGLTWSLA